MAAGAAHSGESLTYKASFKPVLNARTRLLILGSLPGEKSLQERQYYAHPQNRFWDLIGDSINANLRALGYPARLEKLLEHDIGLWDVVARARRKGSLDSAIRQSRNNDLAALTKQMPTLQAIAFNGKTAARLGRKALAQSSRALQLVDLPSSSPAFAAMSYPDKLSRWAVIRSIVRADLLLHK
jgi:hypoxanthine-DNA glycosylase